MKNLLLITLALVLNSVSFSETVDTDKDGVSDWEDNCPNTPSGNRVWTLKIVQDNKGNPKWVGCAGKNIEQPDPAYTPPSKESVLAALPKPEPEKPVFPPIPLAPAVPNGLSQVTVNLIKSFEFVAVSTVKPKALVYRKASQVLKDRQDEPSFAGVISTLCDLGELMEIISPVIETTSSKSFEEVIKRSENFKAMLASVTSGGCSQPSHWQARNLLSLMEGGLSAMGMVGFSETQIPVIDNLKVRIGHSLSSVGSLNLKDSLLELVKAQEEAQPIIASFNENALISGVAILVATTFEKTKLLLENLPSSDVTTNLRVGDAITVSIPQSLINASRLVVVSGFGGSDPAFDNHFEFVAIPLSNDPFWMGSSNSEKGHFADESRHQVVITEPYEIQTTEVTQSLWEKVMGSNPSLFKGPNLPVENVSVEEINRFLERLTQMRNDGYKYRLPTEAEWEFAARAGTETAFSYGDSSETLSDFAWFRKNSSERTQAVRTKRPNNFGLYDVHGNVWEWVSDSYVDNLGAGSPVQNPKITNGSGQVLRGGAWYDLEDNLRSASRGSDSPYKGHAGYGFRLARSLWN